MCLFCMQTLIDAQDISSDVLLVAAKEFYTQQIKKLSKLCLSFYRNVKSPEGLLKQDQKIDNESNTALKTQTKDYGVSQFEAGDSAVSHPSEGTLLPTDSIQQSNAQIKFLQQKRYKDLQSKSRRQSLITALKRNLELQKIVARLRAQTQLNLMNDQLVPSIRCDIAVQTGEVICLNCFQFDRQNSAVSNILQDQSFSSSQARIEALEKQVRFLKPRFFEQKRKLEEIVKHAKVSQQRLQARLEQADHMRSNLRSNLK